MALERQNLESYDEPRSFGPIYVKIVAITFSVTVGISTIVGNCHRIRKHNESAYFEKTNKAVTDLDDYFAKLAASLKMVVDSNYLLTHEENKLTVKVYPSQDVVGNYTSTNGAIEPALPPAQNERPVRELKLVSIPNKINGRDISPHMSRSPYTQISLFLGEDSLMVGGQQIPIIIEFDKDYRITRCYPVQFGDDKSVRELKFDKPLALDSEKLATSLGGLLKSIDAFNKFRERADEAVSKSNKDDNIDHSKNAEFSKKVRQGTVIFDTKVADWDGGDAYCTGWIADRDVIGTAKHCILRKIRYGKFNEALLTRVSKINLGHNQKPHVVTAYRPPNDRSYTYWYEGDSDLAVIVLNKKVFKEKDVLPVRTDPVISDNYYSGHFAGYGTGQYWKMDEGQIHSHGKQGPHGYSELGFGFPAQGGNSGGPIVDSEGKIVSLFALGDYRGSLGPSITQQKMDGLISNARARFAHIKKMNKKNRSGL